MRLKNCGTCAVVLTLLICAAAAAHDTFIFPEKFSAAAGEALTVGVHSADGFPESTGAPKRLVDAFLHTGSSSAPISLKEDGKRMSGSVTPSNTGYMIVTVTNAANVETMRARSFLDYIKEEGLTSVIQAREQNGEADKPARERYTMYAKSIFLAGSPNDAYKRPVGQPIEIVPEKAPHAIKTGDSLPVQVLFRGKPLSGVDLMAATTGPLGAKNRSIGKTDAQGRINIPMQSGKWRLHTIHMERSSAADADWESFWATLTFEVP